MDKILFTEKICKFSTPTIQCTVPGSQFPTGIGQVPYDTRYRYLIIACNLAELDKNPGLFKPTQGFFGGLLVFLGLNE